jgi:starch phosphorylase
MYYERDSQGVPCRWVGRMKNAIMSLAWRFNADRMVIEYARNYYLPAVGCKAVFD